MLLYYYTEWINSNEILELSSIITIKTKCLASPYLSDPFLPTDFKFLIINETILKLQFKQSSCSTRIILLFQK